MGISASFLRSSSGTAGYVARNMSDSFPVSIQTKKSYSQFEKPFGEREGDDPAVDGISQLGERLSAERD